jgi:ABC-type multidrug transport system fused ATPase/permease subunit
MKFLSISAFALVVAFVASLVAGGESSIFLQQSWRRLAGVLPEPAINQLESAAPAYTERVFGLFPPTLREKVVAKLWNVVELITLRLLLALHLAPTFLLAGLIGFLEGSWARSNQQGLVKIHSPMRFSLAMAGAGLCPAVILLWATAPVIVPIVVLTLFVSILEIFSICNLVIHAPTQF